MDLSVINGNYAIEAGPAPNKDALAAEKAEGDPYANGSPVGKPRRFVRPS